MISAGLGTRRPPSWLRVILLTRVGPGGGGCGLRVAAREPPPPGPAGTPPATSGAPLQRPRTAALKGTFEPARNRCRVHAKFRCSVFCKVQIRTTYYVPAVMGRSASREGGTAATDACRAHFQAAGRPRPGPRCSGRGTRKLERGPQIHVFGRNRELGGTYPDVPAAHGWRRVGSRFAAGNRCGQDEGSVPVVPRTPSSPRPRLRLRGWLSDPAR